ncbi:FtsX-like permease family protein [Streptomyces sp. NPDC005485]|uniref:FtsX-like permease family protein n=1 Tax=Streptomyces sp. NPDC005485 TaxID=3155591 RepID=UPI0033BEA63B
MTGFVLLRARAHRLLLAAALLTVLLTTSVLATLTAYSGAIGDASLRHSLLDEHNAVDTSLIVKADISARQQGAADKAVREGARKTFAGLPVTLRTLVRSGPYALPRSLRGPGAASTGDPDLTHFAALDRGQVRVTVGRLPRGPGGPVIEVALPETAAARLGLKPGARLTLVDRLDGPKVRVLITGLYRPTRNASPYWQLDELGGRGINKVSFTTYGPLLADPAVLGGKGGGAGARVSAGETGWLATADFSALSTGRIGALRDAARTGTASLRKVPALSGTTAVTTALPEVLDRVERSLLVSRSTLLIVALQLGLLAGYALLLVARLLSAERAGETRVLRARGGSRGRVAGFAALEALLLAIPAAACAPLLAGPLTRVLAGQGALARIGLRLDSSVGRGGVWLVAACVALGCALAVTVPALTSSDSAEGRARSLPAPVRAGADVGLLVIAGVAYWQLNRRDSGTVSADLSGTLGIDPLLVSAPALALLAGTVLTLRLLPPVARLAERRAASGRGLPAALAGWQFSRRPMRGAGPVLLLVLAVALGMLTIGQGASWNRSQDDQADFRAGTSVRVLPNGAGELGQSGVFAAVPGVREAAPAVRTTLPLSGDRTATALALDTAHAADGVLLRSDLADGPVRPLIAGLAPNRAAIGAALPKGTTLLRATLRIRSDTAGIDADADVAVTLLDRYGTPYRIPAGQLPVDGRAHTLTVDLAKAADAPTGRAAEPLTFTGIQLDVMQPVDSAEQQRLSVEQLSAVGTDGSARKLSLPGTWKAASSVNATSGSPFADSRPTRPRVTKTPEGSRAPLTVTYGTGYVARDQAWEAASLTVRLQAAQPPVPEITAIATDRFLTSAGARTGQRVDVPFGGYRVTVRITHSIRALPTTAGTGQGDGGALLVDLPSVNRVLEARYGESAAPTEWWLRAAPGDAARVASVLRARPDIEPSQVVVRDEMADRLRDDPFGAGPEAAFAAAALVAAALAAVGFAVSTAGSLRERGAEFAVLRALGAPRRQLARLIAAEQAVLVALALLVGVALGAVLTRAVVPFIVLTSDATQPTPKVLVELPLSQAALLLTAVALTPLAVTAFLALHRPDPADSLRAGGE